MCFCPACTPPCPAPIASLRWRATSTRPERGAVATADGSVFVRGTVSNVLTGARSSQTSLFEVQSKSTWTKYSQINITSGTSYFRNLALRAGDVIPQLPIDGGLLAIGATNTLSLASANSFAGGVSDLAPEMTGAGGQVDISASNILILASDQTAPAGDAGYLILDAGQISNLGAASVLIGGTSAPNTTGAGSAASSATGNIITPTAINLEVATDAAHPLTGPELILVTQAGGNGLTVNSGSVIRAVGTVPAGTDQNITIGSTSTGASGDSALLRVSNGTPVTVTQVNVTAPAAAKFTIGSGVTIDGGNSLTLASTGSGSLAPDAKLIARNYDLAGNVINIGGGSSGLILTSATLANFAGAASVQLHSSTVINFYDASGLVIGDPAKAIGALTFDAAGLFSQGGATTINADNVVLTDTQAAPAAVGGLTGSNGALTVNASGAITQGAGSQTLGNFAEVKLNAAQAIIFDGAGGLNAGAANVALTAPTVLVNGKATQALTTTGALSVLQGPGAAAADAANNIGGALTLTAASIYDSGQIEALAGNVTLAATGGDVTLASGAAIIATGSRIAVLDQVEYAPGGAVKLTAVAGNVTIDGGARVDVSAAGIGYAGSLSIQTPGVATLDGALLGGAAFNDVGGNFSLAAGSLVGALPFSGGFTGSFAATLQHGDITIGAAQTLTSGNVLLVADNGSIYVNGEIDASGPTGGAISLYGKGTTTTAAGPGATGVIVGSTAKLYARYQAALAGNPGYANGAASMVQTGRTITLGTSGTPDGTYNSKYGYENVAGSGAIILAGGRLRCQRRSRRRRGYQQQRRRGVSTPRSWPAARPMSPSTARWSPTATPMASSARASRSMLTRCGARPTRPRTPHHQARRSAPSISTESSIPPAGTTAAERWSPALSPTPAARLWRPGMEPTCTAWTAPGPRPPTISRMIISRRRRRTQVMSPSIKRRW